MFTSLCPCLASPAAASSPESLGLVPDFLNRQPPATHPPHTPPVRTYLPDLPDLPNSPEQPNLVNLINLINYVN